MSDAIIQVENLSKKYILEHRQEGKRYVALRDVLTNRARSLTSTLNPFNRNKKNRMITQQEKFWALKDISFEVKQGDRVGVIGRNGAGKSTLLKILSRITEPTQGRVRIRGRVASLLEVGTGFHPELTGRENIYLNGAILGMSKLEIKHKFDEIVSFAEIEQFLDTPVKRYSSGMYVRLAFAVAAHLEPEILVVDEVLAVGDARFQKKCLGKIEDVSNKENRTVLFVSHNMPTITSLCSKCILLEKGEIKKIGDTSDVVMSYYAGDESSAASVDFSQSLQKPGDNYAVLTAASVRTMDNQISPEVSIAEPFKILMRFKILRNSDISFMPLFEIFTSDGTYAFGIRPKTVNLLLVGDYIFECKMPANFLNDGVYFINVSLYSFEPGHVAHIYERHLLSFNVKDPIEGTRGFGYLGPIAGAIRPQFECKTIKLD